MQKKHLFVVELKTTTNCHNIVFTISSFVF